MKIPFFKLHGAKNDFLLTWREDAPTASLPEIAVAICDRYTGVGADGWMLVDRKGGPDFDASIRLFNSDGSEPELSGNGTRCAAALLAGQSAKSDSPRTDFRIRTGAGIKHLRLLAHSGAHFEFEMNMGEPRIPELHATVQNRDAVIVDAGNPQCVMPVSDFPDDWAAIGAATEHDPRFPNRTNVSFVRAVDTHTIDVRFWERGAGLTNSSGTGSTGAVAAALARGLVAAPVRVQTPAGILVLRSENGVLFLTGPAELLRRESITHPRSLQLTKTNEPPPVAIALAAVAESLAEKIRSRTARVGVVGLGYVGLPLAVEYAVEGYHVTGIDLNASKTARVNAGDSYVGDIASATMAPLVESGLLRATTDFSVVRDLDTINICVPTPLRKTKDPDMSYIVDACDEIAKYFHSGMLIILESTTYPGTTDELVRPILEKDGLKAGVDFFLCFSPERVDPGNPKFQTKNIPKVVGGYTPACTEMGRLFYSQALEHVVPVGSTQVAEMVKLLENTFRMINIGMVNEIALMCDGMGINVWEVIDAAATKPFGFMPFYPGPGLGGHCIPIDPFYLSWKTKQAGIEARFIELAGYINGNMPHFVVEKVQSALNNVSKPVKGSHIHILGVAYKRDIDDVRESPALDIIHLLMKRGARVSYSDPYVPEISIDGGTLKSGDEADLTKADCVLIVTDHKAFDYAGLPGKAKLVVDTRNALKGIQSHNIVRL